MQEVGLKEVYFGEMIQMVMAGGMTIQEIVPVHGRMMMKEFVPVHGRKMKKIVPVHGRMMMKKLENEN